MGFIMGLASKAGGAMKGAMGGGGGAAASTGGLSAPTGLKEASSGAGFKDTMKNLQSMTPGRGPGGQVENASINFSPSQAGSVSSSPDSFKALADYLKQRQGG